MLAPGEDLLAKAEQGLAADHLILLLSEASCPKRWPRDRWEPVLIEQARELKSQLFCVLLEDCPFPELLKRRNFADASHPGKRLTAMRLVKRGIHHPGTKSLSISADLETLYTGLSDRPGVMSADGSAITRFGEEAKTEFEAVLWLACVGRNLTQAAGALGDELGLVLPGTLDENIRAIRELLENRRCLLILDGPSPEIENALTVGARTSTLISRHPLRVPPEPPQTLDYARKLAHAHRYAEAYELFYQLLNSGVSAENCARELVWICESWDRIEEGNSLRFHYRPAEFEQLILF